MACFLTTPETRWLAHNTQWPFRVGSFAEKPTQMERYRRHTYYTPGSVVFDVYVEIKFPWLRANIALENNETLTIMMLMKELMALTLLVTQIRFKHLFVFCISRYSVRKLYGMHLICLFASHLVFSAFVLCASSDGAFVHGVLIRWRLGNRWASPNEVYLVHHSHQLEFTSIKYVLICLFVA